MTESFKLLVAIFLALLFVFLVFGVIYLITNFLKLNPTPAKKWWTNKILGNTTMTQKYEIIWFRPSEGLPHEGRQVFVVYKGRFRTMRMGQIANDLMFMDAVACIPVDDVSYWAYPPETLLVEMENA